MADIAGATALARLVALRRRAPAWLSTELAA